MSSMSVEERRRIRAKQKKKQGYSIVTLSTIAYPLAMMTIDKLVSTPPSKTSSPSRPPPTKKQKGVDTPRPSAETQDEAGDLPIDSS